MKVKVIGGTETADIAVLLRANLEAADTEQLDAWHGVAEEMQSESDGCGCGGCGCSRGDGGDDDDEPEEYVCSSAFTAASPRAALPCRKRIKAT